MNKNKDTRDEVIDVLREGRATPRYIVDQTSIDAKQTAQYHLRQLRAEDRVEKVSRGLYELIDGREAIAERKRQILEALEAVAESHAVDIAPDEFEFGDDAGDDR